MYLSSTSSSQTWNCPKFLQGIYNSAVWVWGGRNCVLSYRANLLRSDQIFVFQGHLLVPALRTCKRSSKRTLLWSYVQNSCSQLILGVCSLSSILPHLWVFLLFTAWLLTLRGAEQNRAVTLPESVDSCTLRGIGRGRRQHGFPFQLQVVTQTSGNLTGCTWSPEGTMEISAH